MEVDAAVGPEMTSAEYQPVKALRRQAGDSRIVVFDGHRS
jgi:uncharacterized protein (DUF1330 family)